MRNFTADLNQEAGRSTAYDQIFGELAERLQETLPSLRLEFRDYRTACVTKAAIHSMQKPGQVAVYLVENLVFDFQIKLLFNRPTADAQEFQVKATVELNTTSK